MTVHQTVEAVNVRRGQYSFSETLVTLSDPFAQSAEYIRALRTHIMAQHVEAGRRALAICEAGPKLGATFVATNLAVSLAQAGVKTLLIDGNLRDPMIQNVIKPDRDLPGLRECLSVSGSSVADFVQSDILPNMSVLFSGGAAPNAQELLARSTFEQVINSCLRDYEMTIIDTPPANSCADGRRIASVAAYSLIVSRRHKGLVSDVKTLAGQLRADHSTVIGTVLNDA
ncbi:MAG TPA: CpsD/CapB family tyrosine-protein kinase [Phenylobacterium sp.]|jgi:capsular exopolysaccharide synthesis family protein